MTDTDISQEHRSEQRLVKSLSTPNFSLSLALYVSRRRMIMGEIRAISLLIVNAYSTSSPLLTTRCSCDPTRDSHGPSRH